MFPIYIEQQRNQLSLDDYLQLQALLAQQQAERRALQEKQEQRRIQKAMYKLQVMTELYRRREQEERAVAAYYAAKRKEEQEQRQHRYLIEQQKQLLLQQRQQQHHAALQKQKERELEQYRLLALAQQQKAAEYANPCQALKTAMIEQESESESEAEEEHQDQLATLVKLIFGAQQQQPEERNEEESGAEEEEQEAEEEEQEAEEEEQEAEEEEQEAEEESEAEEEEAKEEAEPEQQQQQQQQQQIMTLDEFVNYIQEKAQSLDDEEDETPAAASEEQADEDMEEDTTVLAIQHIDDNEEDDSMDEDEDYEQVQVPSLVRSTENIQNLVNDILTTTEDDADNFTQFPDEDPVKIAKYDALNRIEQELNEIRQQHEDHVLHVQLDFSSVVNNNDRTASPTDTLITATTAENREFLDYEDQIMKVLLKLDMIESDGDESIRLERKALVKRAEEMLEKLDEFKQKEWERVSCSGHSEDEDMYM